MISHLYFTVIRAMNSGNVVCAVSSSINDGKVLFGHDNIIHPNALFLTVEGGGKIIFGNGNIVEEFATIECGAESLVIGDNNIFQVGSGN